MSNVRTKDRSPHRFETSDKALALYDHTTNLVANARVFDRTYKTLIDDIEYQVTMIYHLCRVAHEDLNHKIKDEAEERIRLQAQAINHCKWLKTDIKLAQRKFKFRAKKAVYWTKLVNETCDLIKKWNDSEIRAAKNNHGL